MFSFSWVFKTYLDDSFKPVSAIFPWQQNVNTTVEYRYNMNS